MAQGKNYKEGYLVYCAEEKLSLALAASLKGNNHYRVIAGIWGHFCVLN